MLEEGFYSHYEFKLEVSDMSKPGACEFEEFNPNWGYLRVWTWQRYVDTF